MPQPTGPIDPQREARFAQYLADGYSIPKIRVVMNLTRGAAQGIMLRIRQQLGWQAV